MFKPVYNYKGIPILPASKNPRIQKKTPQHGPGKVILLLIVVLGIIGFTVWEIADLFIKQKEAPPAPQEKTIDVLAGQPKPEPAPEPAQLQTPAAPVVVPTPAAVQPQPQPEPQVPEVQVVAKGQQAVTQEHMEARVKINQLLMEKKYEEARAALEELLKTLPRNSALFPYAQRLQTVAAKGLKEQGAFDRGVDEYVVKSGDSIDQIAAAHNSTRSAIIRANGIKNANMLRLGQQLKIPRSNWIGKISTGQRTLCIYESGKLIRLYTLDKKMDSGVPRKGQFVTASSNPEWKSYGLGLADIEDVKNLVPLGTTIMIGK